MLRNERVVVFDEIVHPAETESASGGHPGIAVYLRDGTVQTNSSLGQPVATKVKRGEVLFRGPKAALLSNPGSTEVHFVRVEFLQTGKADRWGSSGLAPNYRLLIENDYARVYEIRIPAGVSEPQHTHHDRVVICLAGAQLKHILPDGHEENSTLRTGECVWRPGQTHVGRNIGQTDLWVIAVEPK